MKIPRPDPTQHDPSHNDQPPIDGDDPFHLFGEWFDLAQASEPADANAMTLATTGFDGMPDCRMVLLKGADTDGFVFYTNLESRKGGQLAENARAALCFHWKSLQRQVRIQGLVSAVSDEEADAYYQSRDRSSRIGAWASRQSRPMEGRFELEKAIAVETAKHAVGHIPRPPFWSGYRIAPVRVEFWRHGAFRLHDRLIFARGQTTDPWETARLFP